MRIKLTLVLACMAFGALAQTTKTKNIVFISVDGYRWQELFKGADSSLIRLKKYRQQDSAEVFKKYWGNNPSKRRELLMPFFWGTIAKQGQLYGNRELGNKVNVRNPYWFSYPGRSETITGYADPKVNSNSYPNNPNENVLEFVNQQKGYQGKVVTFAGWAPVAQIVNRDRNKMPLINPYEKVTGTKLTEAQELANELQDYLPTYFGKEVRWDANTYAIAKTYIKANHPRFVYIDFADPDDFGHGGQYDFYLDCANYIDAMIGNLWKSMQADPFYKDNTTFVICPDHGRGVDGKWVSHGTSAPGSNETWMAVIGPDTPANGEMKGEGQVYQDQIAQTMAKLFGFTFTANHSIGEVIPSVFKK